MIIHLHLPVFGQSVLTELMPQRGHKQKITPQNVGHNSVRHHAGGVSVLTELTPQRGHKQKITPQNVGRG